MSESIEKVPSVVNGTCPREEGYVEERKVETCLQSGASLGVPSENLNNISTCLQSGTSLDVPSENLTNIPVDSYNITKNSETYLSSEAAPCGLTADFPPADPSNILIDPAIATSPDVLSVLEKSEKVLPHEHNEKDTTHSSTLDSPGRNGEGTTLKMPEAENVDSYSIAESSETAAHKEAAFTDAEAVTTQSIMQDVSVSTPATDPILGQQLCTHFSCHNENIDENSAETNAEENNLSSKPALPIRGCEVVLKDFRLDPAFWGSSFSQKNQGRCGKYGDPASSDGQVVYTEHDKTVGGGLDGQESVENALIRIMGMTENSHAVQARLTSGGTVLVKQEPQYDDWNEEDAEDPEELDGMPMKMEVHEVTGLSDAGDNRHGEDSGAEDDHDDYLYNFYHGKVKAGGEALEENLSEEDEHSENNSEENTDATWRPSVRGCPSKRRGGSRRGAGNAGKRVKRGRGRPKGSGRSASSRKEVRPPTNVRSRGRGRPRGRGRGRSSQAQDNMKSDPPVKKLRINVSRLEVTEVEEVKQEGPLQCSRCPKVFPHRQSLEGHFYRCHVANKKYQCKHCTYTTAVKSHYLTHVRIHTGEKPFQCTVCDAAFNAPNSLVRHARTHQETPRGTLNTGPGRLRPSKEYICSTCNARLSCHSSLVVHQRTHTGERPFKCEYCDAGFIIKSHLVVHRRRHTGEKPFTCPECPAAFYCNSSLTKHRMLHSGEKPFQCDQCGAAFRVKKNLITHQFQHTGKKPFTCSICGNGFTTAKAMRNHEGKHLGTLPFTCEYCGEKWQSKSIYEKHLRKHTGEKPVFCEICGVGLADRFSYKMHLRTHTGEKPYKCSDCGRAFAQKQARDIHYVSRHTDHRPHECSVCGRTFARKCHLERHIARAHTGQCDYHCDICQATFSTQNSLDAHMRDIHNTSANEKLRTIQRRPSKCMLCKLEFPEPQELLDHLLGHDMTDRCSICNMGFIDRPALETHSMVHMSDASVAVQLSHCVVCGENFENQEALLKHFTSAHVGDKQFICEACGAGFKRKEYLSKHLKSHEGGGAVYKHQCSTCGQSFTQRSQLAAHEHIHSASQFYACDICGAKFTDPNFLAAHTVTQHRFNEERLRPWKCTLCDKAYTQQGPLQAHMRSHTGERPYKCHLCPAAFIRKNNLDNHIRTHSGEKPFKCDECSLAFSRSESLAKHKTLHGGERPYICEVCSVTFVQKHSLRRHERTQSHLQKVMAFPFTAPVATSIESATS